MERTFVEWWNSLTSTEKDTFCIELSQKCNTALSTVRKWGLGYRTPKARSQEIIADYIRTVKKVDTHRMILFPLK